jgi:diguanylate cyclase (GGDEF)-like protein
MKIAPAIKGKVRILFGIFILYEIIIVMLWFQTRDKTAAFLSGKLSDYIFDMGKRQYSLFLDQTAAALEKEIKDRSPEAQIRIIREYLHLFSMRNGDSSDSQVYAFRSDGLIVFFSRDRKIEERRIQEIGTPFYRRILEKALSQSAAGGGAVEYRPYDEEGGLSDAYAMHVVPVRSTPYWIATEINLKGIHFIRDGMISGFFAIIQDYVNLFIIISLSIFVVACVFFFMTSHSIIQIEDESRKQQFKIERNNELLNIEVNLRKQIEDELKAVNRNLEELSTLDGLTRIANRRKFDSHIENEWHRLTREKKPLSLILGDVDNFKHYNDRYGHLQGDECLKTMAVVIRGFCRRPADLAARYGGEEFAMILPDTDGDGAMSIAEGIRHAIEKRGLTHEGISGNTVVTMSFGVATLSPTRSESPVDLIGAADRALYRAKELGRNRVEEEEFMGV